MKPNLVPNGEEKARLLKMFVIDPPRCTVVIEAALRKSSNFFMIAKFLVLTGIAPEFKTENGYEHKPLVSEWC